MDIEKGKKKKERWERWEKKKDVLNKQPHARTMIV